MLARLGFACALFAGILLLPSPASEEARHPTPPSRPAPAASRSLKTLRVCADLDNLPISNQAGEGFENALARLVAKDLGADLEYYWQPQRRGFIRTSLGAGRCDLMMGAPAHLERVLPTIPYYRSTYVFVTRRDGPPVPRSLDNPALGTLRIGVQILGDDPVSSPPAEALAHRGLATNVVAFSVYDDYSLPNPTARIIDAVANRSIDVAIAWGPLAGYFARHRHAPLAVTPLEPRSGSPRWPFAFDIAMGVHKGNNPLRDRLNDVIRRRHREIDALLDAYEVVRLPPDDAVPAAHIGAP